MDLAHVIAVLAGLACLAGSWAVWSGHYKAAGKDLLHPNWAWTVVPALAAVLLAYGLEPLLGDVASWVFGVLALLAFALFFWQPDWFGPRWWRERDRSDLGQEWGTNALLLGLTKPGMGDSGSLSQALAMMAPEEPSTRMRGALVTARHGRPSAGQRPGVVEGWLLLYERGVVFAASAMEDKMREAPVVERLAAADMRSTRRVPRGTQEDGGRRVRDVKTLVMGRVEVGARGGDWVVETRSPGRLVRELEQRYGVRARGAVGAER